MQVEIKDGNLIITVPVSTALHTSKSGKTLIVATSAGNKETEVEVQGKKVIVGFNAYIMKD